MEEIGISAKLEKSAEIWVQRITSVLHGCLLLSPDILKQAYHKHVSDYGVEPTVPTDPLDQVSSSSSSSSLIVQPCFTLADALSPTWEEWTKLAVLASPLHPLMKQEVLSGRAKEDKDAPETRSDAVMRVMYEDEFIAKARDASAIVLWFLIKDIEGCTASSFRAIFDRVKGIDHTTAAESFPEIVIMRSQHEIEIEKMYNNNQSVQFTVRLLYFGETKRAKIKSSIYPFFEQPGVADRYKKFIALGADCTAAALWANNYREENENPSLTLEAYLPCIQSGRLNKLEALIWSLNGFESSSALQWEEAGFFPSKAKIAYEKGFVHPKEARAIIDSSPVSWVDSWNDQS